MVIGAAAGSFAIGVHVSRVYDLPIRRMDWPGLGLLGLLMVSGILGADAVRRATAGRAIQQPIAWRAVAGALTPPLHYWGASGIAFTRDHADVAAALSGIFVGLVGLLIFDRRVGNGPSAAPSHSRPRSRSEVG